MAGLDTNISEAATQPKKATADGVQYEGRSVGEIIEADKYAEAKAATRKGRNPWNGLLRKIKPGGTA